ncbi:MAG: hypothetical protein E6767_18785 [Dysgonomonas sp.]|nr:hypothetical protein [Dysgonomonas sp.]
MKIVIDKKRAGLIRRYHSLCSALGLMDDERKVILKESFNVESSKDLYPEELKIMNETLSNELKERGDRMNVQRRKLLALIYEFSKHKGYSCTKEKALNIACIACDVKLLNDATEQKLIAAIKSFEKNEGNAWADAVLGKISEDSV